MFLMEFAIFVALSLMYLKNAKCLQYKSFNIKYIPQHIMLFSLMLYNLMLLNVGKIEGKTNMHSDVCNYTMYIWS